MSFLKPFLQERHAGSNIPDDPDTPLYNGLPGDEIADNSKRSVFLEVSRDEAETGHEKGRKCKCRDNSTTTRQTLMIMSTDASRGFQQQEHARKFQQQKHCHMFYEVYNGAKRRFTRKRYYR